MERPSGAGGWRRAAVAALAMLAASAGLVSGAQAASCTGTRTSHSDADCLSATWGNRGRFKKSWYEVRNECSAYGTVVVFVDRTSRDHKHTLLNSNTVRRTNRSKKHVRNVYCCASESDLCNEADITADGCRDRWRDSPADDSCMMVSPGNVTVTDDNQCRIENAWCQKSGGTGLNKEAGITTKWNDFDDIDNCNGTLTFGSC